MFLQIKVCYYTEKKVSVIYRLLAYNALLFFHLPGVPQAEIKNILQIASKTKEIFLMCNSNTEYFIFNQIS